MNPEMQHLFDALKNVQDPFTIVFFATLVGGTVRILKTKKVGDVLDALPFTRRIPKDYLPYAALLLAGLIAFLDAKVNAGLGWRASAWSGVVGMVLSGGTAIGIHESVAKPLGKLLSKPPTDGGRPNATETILPPSPQRSAPPPPPEAARAWPVLRWIHAIVLALAIFLAACGLTRSDVKDAKDTVLSVSDIVCVEDGKGALLVDVDGVSEACGILKSPLTREVLRQLIGQREAAKRAGFRWLPEGVTETVTDAGHRD